MAPIVRQPTDRRTETLYGRNAVIEALRGRRAHRRLHVAHGAERQERVSELLSRARELNLPVSRAHIREMDQLVGEVNHQGVALETSPYLYTELEEILEVEHHPPILVLDHLQDPQNLGSLLRSAEASGVAGVVFPDRRSASVTPAVVNASAGAVELLHVARVTNLARALEECKEAGYWVLALEHRDDARSIFFESIPEPTVLLIGSEGKGVGPALLRHADLVVDIPMAGRIESLNAAVAGSIALYELLRRQLASSE